MLLTRWNNAKSRRLKGKNKGNSKIRKMDEDRATIPGPLVCATCGGTLNKHKFSLVVQPRNGNSRNGPDAVIPATAKFTSAVDFETSSHWREEVPASPPPLALGLRCIIKSRLNSMRILGFLRFRRSYKTVPQAPALPCRKMQRLLQTTQQLRADQRRSRGDQRRFLQVGRHARTLRCQQIPAHALRCPVIPRARYDVSLFYAPALPCPQIPDSSTAETDSRARRR